MSKNQALFTAFLLPVQLSSQIMTQCRAAYEIGQALDLKWTHPKDLHITVGYIKCIREEDSQLVMDLLAQAELPFAKFTVTQTGFRVLGNAFTLTVEPKASMYEIFKFHNLRLQAGTQNKYSFDLKSVFTPHITLARFSRDRRPTREQLTQIEKTLRPSLSSVEFEVSSLFVLHRASKPQTHRYAKLMELALSQNS